MQTRICKPGTKFSRDELTGLFLPDRKSAMEVARAMVLPQESNVVQKLDFSLTPYLIDPVMLIGDHRVEWVFLIWPTQSAKTVYLQIVVSDAIDQDPGTIIYCLPDERNGKKALKEKIIELIRNTPFLSKHVNNWRSVGYDHIHLDNMSIYPAWSNSPGTVSSSPSKKVIADEVRLFLLEVKGEANALDQLYDRLTTYLEFGQGQGFAVSSPSVKDDLLYQQTELPGTQNLFWHTKCKQCGKYSLMDFFRNLIIDFDNSTGTAICHFCDNPFSDLDKKREMNRMGCYAPRGFEGSEVGRPIDDFISDRMVFRICSMSSPFRNFNRIARRYIQVKDKTHMFMGFWQTWLARFWEREVSKTTKKQLESRKSPLVKRGVVPKGTKFLLAGVDSQGPGFNVVVCAFGPNLISLVDEFYIHSQSMLATSEQVELLFKNRIVNRVYKDEYNKKWRVALWGIDTGGNRTKQVYGATAGLPNCVRIKGAAKSQPVVIKYNQQIDLYLVKTDYYADESDELSFSDDFYLPESVSEDFINQFLNYIKIEETDKKTGDKKYYYRKTGVCDYRLAFVQMLICLDIQLSDIGATLRDVIDNREFTEYNPEFIVQLNNKKDNNESNHRGVPTEPEELYEDYEEEDHVDYGIDNFTGGW